MRKLASKVGRKVAQYKSEVFGSLGLAGTAAHAAVPTELETAMTAGATDAAAVAVLGLLIVVGVAVVKYMKRGVG